MFKKLDRQVISWALYDWGNSAFAVVMLTAFFPPFFKQFLSADLDATTSTFWLGIANASASMIIVLLAPIMGAIADASCSKKRFLISFAILGIVTTFMLVFADKGEWQFGLLLYVMATVGFMGANVFYDSLIVIVAPEDKLDVISGLGYALGYLGGGLLLAVDVAMFLMPEKFGFDNATQAIQASFISVAIWWALFSLPLIFFVKERKANKNQPAGQAVVMGFRQLRDTLREIKKLKVVMLFLLAYWLYIDGVDTIIRMAVDYGLSIGFDTGNLITAILITQFVGFPAAIAFGLLGQRIGAKKGILIAIAVYIMVTVWAFWMDNVYEFYGLAIVVGLVQGGVQSLSRSFYARIIPSSKSGEFFGFYNMLGKFAAVLGPLIMGVVSLLTKDPRLSILSVVVLFVAGAVLLWFVDEEKGQRMAQELN
ncbi:MAG: MFS transporter [Gammaproteobacteria bacterium]|nr:MFS transporter [Gammaproteobacteria bacterium]